MIETVRSAPSSAYCAMADLKRFAQTRQRTNILAKTHTQEAEEAKEPTESAAIVAQESAPVAHVYENEAEIEIAEFFGELEEWLNTPFVQPSAIAEEGVPFTIYKASRRWAKKVDAKNEDDMVEQFMYLVTIDKDFFYTTKSREPKAFNKGDYAILSYSVNSIREKSHDKIMQVLEQTGTPIPNMTLRFVPAKRKGHSPSVTLCHITSWRSLG